MRTGEPVGAWTEGRVKGTRGSKHVDEDGEVWMEAWSGSGVEGSGCWQMTGAVWHGRQAARRTGG